jgi:hypothetical protein
MPKGTYPWSFITQIFRNSYSSRGGGSKIVIKYCRFNKNYYDEKNWNSISSLYF